MTIAADGNVGIGITDPLARLHVDQIIRLSRSGTQAGLQLVRVTGTDITGILSGNELARIDLRGGFDTTTASGARISGLASEDWTALSNPADMIFSTTPSGATVPTEKMRIDSEGNVGIGVEDPANKLEIEGINTETANAPMQVIINDLSTEGSRIRMREAGSTRGVITSYGSAPTNNPERANNLTLLAPQGKVTGLFSGVGIASEDSKFEVVSALPGTPDPNTIYFVV